MSKYNNENPRFWSMDLENTNKKDLLKWFVDDLLIGIVDEEEGGIIGYVNPKFVDDVLSLLNKNG